MRFLLKEPLDVASLMNIVDGILLVLVVNFTILFGILIFYEIYLIYRLFNIFKNINEIGLYLF